MLAFGHKEQQSNNLHKHTNPQAPIIGMQSTISNANIVSIECISFEWIETTSISKWEIELITHET